MEPEGDASVCWVCVVIREGRLERGRLDKKLHHPLLPSASCCCCNFILANIPRMALMLNLAVATLSVAAAAAAPGKPAAVAITSRRSLLVGTTTKTSRRKKRPVVAMAADMLGDFGARDPFPEEIASNFGEKTLGNVDTLHRILIPTLSVLSLSRVPLQDEPEALSHEDARRLLHKVVGWRLLFPDSSSESEMLKLECVWKVKDQASGEELIARIHRALDGYTPATLALEEAPATQVRAQLYSTSLGGLSVNDFIMAARIDQIKTQDLIPKKRVWA